MFKPMVAATALLAIVGSSTVYAQQCGHSDARFEQQYRPSTDDVKAFTDARIAALRAGLQPTPEQETNWPPFEQAVRDLVKLRVERMQARETGGEQQPSTDPFERLQHRADAMTRLSAALKGVANAGAPLYQSLSDAQKRRFTFLAQVLRPHWMHGGRFGEEYGGRGGPHGMMGLEGDDDGPRGMMGSGGENGGPRGMMMGPDRDED
jgi:zinc resistance-associated protein